MKKMNHYKRKKIKTPKQNNSIVKNPDFWLLIMCLFFFLVSLIIGFIVDFVYVILPIVMFLIFIVCISVNLAINEDYY